MTQLEALILRFLYAFSASGSLFRGCLVAQQTSFHTNKGEEGLPRGDCHFSGGVLPASHSLWLVLQERQPWVFICPSPAHKDHALLTQAVNHGA